MSEEKTPLPKSRLERSTDLLRAVLWPAFAFTVLLSFWTPLREVVKAVPKLIGDSEAITIGDVSLKISKDLRSKLPPDVKMALNGISTEGIKFLFRYSSTIRLGKGQVALMRPEA